MTTTEKYNKKLKILICSTTNVAVDRILKGLLELGFDDFVRVGSFRKIAKTILPYSLHTTNQDVTDLKLMLKHGDLNKNEQRDVKASLGAVKNGSNLQKIQDCSIVGATLMASMFQCLDKIEFPIIIIDECSQMTEPLTCIPLSRFKCKKMILVGDPKQL